MSDFPFNEGDILITKDEKVNEYSTFLRVLSVDREKRLISYDAYTHFGKNHLLYSGKNFRYGENEKFTPKYYRHATLGEIIAFRDGVKCWVDDVLHKNDTAPLKTITYLDEVITERTKDYENRV